MNAENIIRGLPEAQYHAMTDRVSKSMLDKVARTPAHYRASLTAPNEETPAMLNGRAFHAWVLEDRPPVVRPQFGGKGAVAARAEWDEQHKGLTVVSEAEFAALEGMRQSLMRHPLIGPAIERKDAERELTLLFERQGRACKARVDLLVGNVALDLKTTEDAGPDAFARSVATYRYHVQDVWYTDALALCGRGPVSFLFVAVERKPPYAVGLYVLDETAQEVGRMLAERDLDRIIECERSGVWPAYPTEVRTLSLPRWATPTGAVT